MPETVQLLKDKLEEKSAEVAIIGLGYIGLPLARSSAAAGFRVTGYDIDEKKTEMLRRGGTYFSHIPQKDIAEMVAGGNFQATSDFTALSNADIVIICLPTPLNAHREPDLGYVESAARSIRSILKPGMLVILESTTYPGTTTEVVLPILEESGLACGKDFFLAYSPEREDPGNSQFQTQNIPKVVGGYDDNSLQLANRFYSKVVTQTIPVSSLATAEAVKLTENIFRSVNIALVNELKTIFDSMGINVWEVIDAASSKPFGYMRFEPGPGWGGHCIPIDPFYLTWKAREYGLATRFIEIAGEINLAMPQWIINKLWQHLNLAGKSINNSAVLIVGVAYKKNVDDQRESPALVIMDELKKLGARVNFHDPLIPEIKESREYSHWAGMTSTALSSSALAKTDAVIIITDHDNIDYELIALSAPLVLDSRGVYFKRYPELHKRIIDV